MQVIHPIYGPDIQTGKANGIFVQVKFDRDLSGGIPARPKNCLYVSVNVLTRM